MAETPCARSPCTDSRTSTSFSGTSTCEIVAALAPEISVSLSSEVDPTFREYERLCVTAFDAYLGPVVKRYLAGLADTLRGLGIRAVPLIMRSRGGIVSAALAARQPVTLFLSGPAAGVIGAGFAAERSGVRDFVSLDRGGTSDDVGVVRNGAPLLGGEGSIGPYPVRTPMVDVNTIGAGGGSIAWIDAAGGLRVGPRSAGAEPGPACYRRGGDDATVTDASVVLGYLNPARFAGGAMALDVRAAERAVAAIGQRLGVDTVAAAAGIHRVINARMADQIRLVTIKRGYDPRQFSLVVLGGAGPVHGAALAAEMGMAEVLVPEAPGVLAAFGLLAAAIEHHHARTLQARTDVADLAAVNRCLAELDAAGRARMHEEGVAAADVHVAYTADMRYVGQAYELEVPIAAPVAAERVPDIVAALHAVHERVYGYARTQQTVEFVNFRAVHTYRLPRPVVRPSAQAHGRLDDARVGERRAYFDGFVSAAIYERAPVARRAPDGAGDRRADGHDDGHPAGRDGDGGRRRQPAPPESLNAHRPDPAGGAAQSPRRHRRRDGADAAQERRLADREGGTGRLGRALQHAR